MNFREAKEANKLIDELENLDSFITDVQIPGNVLTVYTNFNNVSLKGEHKTKVIQVILGMRREMVKELNELGVVEDIDDCYTTGIYGIVDRLENFSTPYKEGCYKRGLIFKTREQAEQHDKELILLFKLHKWAEEHNGGWTPNWNDYKEGKWTVMYHNECEEFEIYENYRYREFLKLPYFESEEIAEQFIEEFGEEIKEVLC